MQLDSGASGGCKRERLVDSLRHRHQQCRISINLITEVMQRRGYPMSDFEQRSADLSVEHGTAVQDYRAAHAVSMATERGQSTTEDQREAMVHYRSLFDEMVGAGTDSNDGAMSR